MGSMTQVLIVSAILPSQAEATGAAREAALAAAQRQLAMQSGSAEAHMHDAHAHNSLLEASLQVWLPQCCITECKSEQQVCQMGGGAIDRGVPHCKEKHGHLIRESEQGKILFTN
jgi:hypothetical protein